MAAFLAALGGVTTIFLIGAFGYLLARAGTVGPDAKKNLPKIITTILLPLYLFRNMATTMDRAMLLDLLYGAVIPFISIGVSFCVAFALSRFLPVLQGRKGIFCVGFSFASAVSIGLPVVAALFGDEGLPYALLYLFANATLFWTFGNYSIAADGNKGTVRLLSLATLKRVCSPPLIGFLGGVCMVLFDLQLPGFLDKAVKYVGDMAIGLGIIYAGVMLYDASIKASHIDRDVVLVLAGRLLLAPGLVLLLSLWLPMPVMMRDVFFIVSSLPVLIQVPLLSAHHGADTRYATLVTGLSTLLCLVTLPVYMVFLSIFLQ
jgi:Predicted permeases